MSAFSDLKRRRETQIVPVAALPVESLASASAVPEPQGDIERLTTETKRRLLSADKRERTQTAYERSTESMQELLLLIQWWRSNTANSRLAIAQISEARRADAN
jgi:hypothetical protein